MLGNPAGVGAVLAGIFTHTLSQTLAAQEFLRIIFKVIDISVGNI